MLFARDERLATGDRWLAMHIASIIGWLVIIIAAIVVVASKREEDRSRQGRTTAKKEICEDETWCGAIENLARGAVLIFDHGLCLDAAGPGSRTLVGGAARGSHLVDMVPPDAASVVLEGAAGARRGTPGLHVCTWNGRMMNVATSAIGERVAVLVVPIGIDGG